LTKLKCGRVTEAAGQSFISIFDQDGHLIADVWLLHDDGSNNPADGVAYARMFAAAPDMYESLKGLVVLREKALVAEKPTNIFEIMQDYWNLAYHALAKAEGREVE